jgi:cell wall assembly regulator SMI1
MVQTEPTPQNSWPRPEAADTSHPFAVALKDFFLEIDQTVGGNQDLATRDVRTVSGNTTAAPQEVLLADASSQNITVTLPTPTEGYSITIKRTDGSSNTLSVAPSSTESIEAITLVSDGTDWFLI